MVQISSNAVVLAVALSAASTMAAPAKNTQPRIGMVQVKPPTTQPASEAVSANQYPERREIDEIYELYGRELDELDARGLEGMALKGLKGLGGLFKHHHHHKAASAGASAASSQDTSGQQARDFDESELYVREEDLDARSLEGLAFKGLKGLKGLAKHHHHKSSKAVSAASQVAGQLGTSGSADQQPQSRDFDEELNARDFDEDLEARGLMKAGKKGIKKVKGMVGKLFHHNGGSAAADMGGQMDPNAADQQQQARDVDDFELYGRDTEELEARGRADIMGHRRVSHRRKHRKHHKHHKGAKGAAGAAAGASADPAAGAAPTEPATSGAGAAPTDPSAAAPPAGEAPASATPVARDYDDWTEHYARRFEALKAQKPMLKHAAHKYGPTVLSAAMNAGQSMLEQHQYKKQMETEQQYAQRGYVEDGEYWQRRALYENLDELD